MEKLVSVIVPTYNGEKFIAQTLGAIINQDYENIEIIVVDDVSTDNTVEVAKKTLECSGRKFQLIRRTVNGHQSASRNTGLDASNGDYVIFFDHDDLAEKNFVSSLVREAEDKNADLVFCGFRYFYKTENRYEPEKFLPKKPLVEPEDYLRAWAKEEITLWSIWNFIFRKDFLLKKNLRFFEKIYIYEDFEFIFKAIPLSSRMSYVNDVLYTHIYHPLQQSQTDPVLVNHNNDYKNYFQIVSALWWGGRCILKHTNDKTIRTHVFLLYIAMPLLRYCRLCIRAGDKQRYDRLVTTLKHKKIRRIMLLILTSQKDVGLFFKAFMMTHFPNFYFKIRSKMPRLN